MRLEKLFVEGIKLRELHHRQVPEPWQLGQLPVHSSRVLAPGARQHAGNLRRVAVEITISLIDPVTERNLGFWLAFLIFSKSKTRKPAGAFGDPRGVDNIGWTRPTGVDFGGCPPLDGRHRHDANFNLGVGRADRHSVPKIVPVAVWMR